MSRNAVADSPPLAAVELIASKTQCCFAFDNVVLVCALYVPDSAYLSAWVDVVLRHAKSYPEGLGMIVSIAPNAPAPTEEERGRINEAFGKLQGVLRGLVQIVEGSGFKAAAKRGALTLMNMASRSAIPTKVAGDIAEATPILRKLLGNAMHPKLDAPALERAADSMRARLAG